MEISDFCTEIKIQAKLERLETGCLSLSYSYLVATNPLKFEQRRCSFKNETALHRYIKTLAISGEVNNWEIDDLREPSIPKKIYKRYSVGAKVETFSCVEDLYKEVAIETGGAWISLDLSTGDSLQYFYQTNHWFSTEYKIFNADAESEWLEAVEKKENSPWKKLIFGGLSALMLAPAALTFISTLRDAFKSAGGDAPLPETDKVPAPAQLSPGIARGSVRDESPAPTETGTSEASRPVNETREITPKRAAARQLLSTVLPLFVSNSTEPQYVDPEGLALDFTLTPPPDTVIFSVRSEGEENLSLGLATSIPATQIGAPVLLTPLGTQSAASMSADGKLLVGDGPRVQVFDPATLTNIVTHNITGPAYDIKQPSVHAPLFVAQGSSIIALNTSTSPATAIQEYPGTNIRYVAVGSNLVFGSDVATKQVLIFNRDTGALISTIGPFLESPLQLEFREFDNTLFITAGYHIGLAMCSLADPSHPDCSEHAPMRDALALALVGDHVLVTNAIGFYIWEAKEGRLKLIYFSPLHSFAETVASDGSTAFAGSGRVTSFDVSQLPKVRKSGDVKGIVDNAMTRVVPHGSNLFEVGNSQTEATLRKFATGKLSITGVPKNLTANIGDLQQGNSVAMANAPIQIITKNNSVFTISSDGLEIYTLPNLTLAGSLPAANCQGIAFFPNSNTLALATGSLVVADVSNMSTPSPQRTLSSIHGSIIDVVAITDRIAAIFVASYGIEIIWTDGTSSTPIYSIPLPGDLNVGVFLGGLCLSAEGILYVGTHEANTTDGQPCLGAVYKIVLPFTEYLAGIVTTPPNLVRRYDLPCAAKNLVLTADGKFLVGAGGKNGGIFVINLSTNQVYLLLSDGLATGVAVIKGDDEPYFFVLATDQGAKFLVFYPNEFSPLTQINLFNTNATAVAVAGNGEELVLGTPTSLQRLIGLQPNATLTSADTDLIVTGRNASGDILQTKVPIKIFPPPTYQLPTGNVTYPVGVTSAFDGGRITSKGPLTVTLTPSDPQAVIAESTVGGTTSTFSGGQWNASINGSPTSVFEVNTLLSTLSISSTAIQGLSVGYEVRDPIHGVVAQGTFPPFTATSSLSFDGIPAVAATGQADPLVAFNLFPPNTPPFNATAAPGRNMTVAITGSNPALTLIRQDAEDLHADISFQFANGQGTLEGPPDAVASVMRQLGVKAAGIEVNDPQASFTLHASDGVNNDLAPHTITSSVFPRPASPPLWTPALAPDASLTTVAGAPSGPFFVGTVSAPDGRNITCSLEVKVNGQTLAPLPVWADIHAPNAQGQVFVTLNPPENVTGVITLTAHATTTVLATGQQAPAPLASININVHAPLAKPTVSASPFNTSSTLPAGVGTTLTISTTPFGNILAQSGNITVTYQVNGLPEGCTELPRDPSTPPTVTCVMKQAWIASPPAYTVTATLTRQTLLPDGTEKTETQSETSPPISIPAVSSLSLILTGNTGQAVAGFPLLAGTPDLNTAPNTAYVTITFHLNDTQASLVANTTAILNPPNLGFTQLNASTYRVKLPPDQIAALPGFLRLVYADPEANVDVNISGQIEDENAQGQSINFPAAFDPLICQVHPLAHQAPHLSQALPPLTTIAAEGLILVLPNNTCTLPPPEDQTPRRVQYAFQNLRKAPANDTESEQVFTLSDLGGSFNSTTRTLNFPTLPPGNLTLTFTCTNPPNTTATPVPQTLTVLPTLQAPLAPANKSGIVAVGTPFGLSSGVFVDPNPPEANVSQMTLETQVWVDGVRQTVPIPGLTISVTPEHEVIVSGTLSNSFENKTITVEVTATLTQLNPYTQHERQEIARALITQNVKSSLSFDGIPAVAATGQADPLVAFNLFPPNTPPFNATAAPGRNMTVAITGSNPALTLIRQDAEDLHADITFQFANGQGILEGPPDAVASVMRQLGVKAESIEVHDPQARFTFLASDGVNNDLAPHTITSSVFPRPASPPLWTPALAPDASLTTVAGAPSGPFCIGTVSAPDGRNITCSLEVKVNGQTLSPLPAWATISSPNAQGLVFVSLNPPENVTGVITLTAHATTTVLATGQQAPAPLASININVHAPLAKPTVSASPFNTSSTLPAGVGTNVTVTTSAFGNIAEQAGATVAYTVTGLPAGWQVIQENPSIPPTLVGPMKKEWTVEGEQAPTVTVSGVLTRGTLVPDGSTLTEITAAVPVSITLDAVPTLSLGMLVASDTTGTAKIPFSPFNSTAPRAVLTAAPNAQNIVVKLKLSDPTLLLETPAPAPLSFSAVADDPGAYLLSGPRSAIDDASLIAALYALQITDPHIDGSGNYLFSIEYLDDGVNDPLPSRNFSFNRQAYPHHEPVCSSALPETTYVAGDDFTEIIPEGFCTLADPLEAAAPSRQIEYEVVGVIIAGTPFPLTGLFDSLTRSFSGKTLPPAENIGLTFKAKNGPAEKTFTQTLRVLPLLQPPRALSTFLPQPWQVGSPLNTTLSFDNALNPALANASALTFNMEVKLNDTRITPTLEQLKMTPLIQEGQVLVRLNGVIPDTWKGQTLEIRVIASTTQYNPYTGQTNIQSIPTSLQSEGKIPGSLSLSQLVANAQGTAGIAFLLFNTSSTPVLTVAPTATTVDLTLTVDHPSLLLSVDLSADPDSPLTWDATQSAQGIYTLSGPASALPQLITALQSIKAYDANIEHAFPVGVTVSANDHVNSAEDVALTKKTFAVDLQSLPHEAPQLEHPLADAATIAAEGFTTTLSADTCALSALESSRQLDYRLEAVLVDGEALSASAIANYFDPEALTFSAPTLPPGEITLQFACRNSALDSAKTRVEKKLTVLPTALPPTVPENLIHQQIKVGSPFHWQTAKGFSNPNPAESQTTPLAYETVVRVDGQAVQLPLDQLAVEINDQYLRVSGKLPKEFEGKIVSVEVIATVRQANPSTPTAPPRVERSSVTLTSDPVASSLSLTPASLEAAAPGESGKVSPLLKPGTTVNIGVAPNSTQTVVEIYSDNSVLQLQLNGTSQASLAYKNDHWELSGSPAVVASGLSTLNTFTTSYEDSGAAQVSIIIKDGVNTPLTLPPLTKTFFPRPATAPQWIPAFGADTTLTSVAGNPSGPFFVGTVSAPDGRNITCSLEVKVNGQTLSPLPAWATISSPNAQGQVFATLNPPEGITGAITLTAHATTTVLATGQQAPTPLTPFNVNVRAPLAKPTVPPVLIASASPLLVPVGASANVTTSPFGNLNQGGNITVTYTLNGLPAECQALPRNPNTPPTVTCVAQKEWIDTPTSYTVTTTLTRITPLPDGTEKTEVQSETSPPITIPAVRSLSFDGIPAVAATGQADPLVAFNLFPPNTPPFNATAAPGRNMTVAITGSNPALTLIRQDAEDLHADITFQFANGQGILEGPPDAVASVMRQLGVKAESIEVHDPQARFTFLASDGVNNDLAPHTITSSVFPRPASPPLWTPALAPDASLTTVAGAPSGPFFVGTVSAPDGRNITCSLEVKVNGQTLSPLPAWATISSPNAQGLVFVSLNPPENVTGVITLTAHATTTVLATGQQAPAPLASININVHAPLTPAAPPETTFTPSARLPAGVGERLTINTAPFSKEADTEIIYEVEDLPEGWRELPRQDTSLPPRFEGEMNNDWIEAAQAPHVRIKATLKRKTILLDGTEKVETKISHSEYLVLSALRSLSLTLPSTAATGQATRTFSLFPNQDQINLATAPGVAEVNATFVLDNPSSGVRLTLSTFRGSPATLLETLRGLALSTPADNPDAQGTVTGTVTLSDGKNHPPATVAFTAAYTPLPQLAPSLNTTHLTEIQRHLPEIVAGIAQEIPVDGLFQAAAGDPRRVMVSVTSSHPEVEVRMLPNGNLWIKSPARVNIGDVEIRLSACSTTADGRGGPKTPAIITCPIQDPPFTSLLPNTNAIEATAARINATVAGNDVRVDPFALFVPPPYGRGMEISLNGTVVNEAIAIPTAPTVQTSAQPITLTFIGRAVTPATATTPKKPGPETPLTVQGRLQPPPADTPSCGDSASRQIVSAGDAAIFPIPACTVGDGRDSEVLLRVAVTQGGAPIDPQLCSIETAEGERLALDLVPLAAVSGGRVVVATHKLMAGEILVDFDFINEPEHTHRQSSLFVFNLAFMLAALAAGLVGTGLIAALLYMIFRAKPLRGNTAAWRIVIDDSTLEQTISLENFFVLKNDAESARTFTLDTSRLPSSIHAQLSKDGKRLYINADLTPESVGNYIILVTDNQGFAYALPLHVSFNELPRLQKQLEAGTLTTFPHPNPPTKNNISYRIIGLEYFSADEKTASSNEISEEAGTTTVSCNETSVTCDKATGACTIASPPHIAAVGKYIATLAIEVPNSPTTILQKMEIIVTEPPVVEATWKGPSEIKIGSNAETCDLAKWFERSDGRNPNELIFTVTITPLEDTTAPALQARSFKWDPHNTTLVLMPADNLQGAGAFRVEIEACMPQGQVVKAPPVQIIKDAPAPGIPVYVGEAGFLMPEVTAGQPLTIILSPKLFKTEGRTPKIDIADSSCPYIIEKFFCPDDGSIRIIFQTPPVIQASQESPYTLTVIAINGECKTEQPITVNVLRPPCSIPYLMEEIPQGKQGSTLILKGREAIQGKETVFQLPKCGTSDGRKLIYQIELFKKSGHTREPIQFGDRGEWYEVDIKNHTLKIKKNAIIGNYVAVVTVINSDTRLKDSKSLTLEFDWNITLPHTPSVNHAPPPFTRPARDNPYAAQVAECARSIGAFFPELPPIARAEREAAARILATASSAASPPSSPRSALSSDTPPTPRSRQALRRRLLPRLPSLSPATPGSVFVRVDDGSDYTSLPGTPQLSEPRSPDGSFGRLTLPRVLFPAAGVAADRSEGSRDSADAPPRTASSDESQGALLGNTSRVSDAGIIEMVRRILNINRP